MPKLHLGAVSGTAGPSTVWASNTKEKKTGSHFSSFEWVEITKEEKSLEQIPFLLKCQARKQGWSPWCIQFTPEAGVLFIFWLRFKFLDGLTLDTASRSREAALLSSACCHDSPGYFRSALTHPCTIRDYPGSKRGLVCPSGSLFPCCVSVVQDKQNEGCRLSCWIFSSCNKVRGVWEDLRGLYCKIPLSH